MTVNGAVGNASLFCLMGVPMRMTSDLLERVVIHPAANVSETFSCSGDGQIFVRGSLKVDLSVISVRVEVDVVTSEYMS